MKDLPVVDEYERQMVLKRLPATKDDLIGKLGEAAVTEKEARTLIWKMRVRAEIYISDGIVKKV